ncbi:MAG: RNA polymerase sporulation sigma factor SigK [Lachnospiraceae bacterium]|nr:RNA polymerase sporulation sigma factor SigK [Lachnospiraceae bacterium]
MRRFFTRLFGGELYYIGGSEALPEPLSPEEEAETLDRLENGEDVGGTLIEHNLRLVVYIAKRFDNTGVGIEDLISIGTIGLIKGVRTFRREKGIKLATYASRCIENEILMYLRKTAGRRAEVSIDEPLSTDGDGNDLRLSDVIGSDGESVYRQLETDEDRKTVAEALAKLSPREREIIELRFGMNGRKEHTQKEVADLLGISQSYISRLEKKIIAKLREDIEAKV